VSHQVAASDDANSLYDPFYNGEQDIAAWRAMSARHKVDHILGILQPNWKLIDVGAGDGAIAAELDRHRAVESVVCAELSASGAQKIRERNLDIVDRVVEFDGYNIPTSFFQSKRQALPKYLIRRAVQAGLGSEHASRLFTYNCVLHCRSASPGNT